MWVSVTSGKQQQNETRNFWWSTNIIPLQETFAHLKQRAISFDLSPLALCCCYSFVCRLFSRPRLSWTRWKIVIARHKRVLHSRRPCGVDVLYIECVPSLPHCLQTAASNTAMHYGIEDMHSTPGSTEQLLLRFLLLSQISASSAPFP